jgi:hypothetical protein
MKVHMHLYDVEKQDNMRQRMENDLPEEEDADHPDNMGLWDLDLEEAKDNNPPGGFLPDFDQPYTVLVGYTTVNGRKMRVELFLPTETVLERDYIDYYKD